MMSPIQLTEDKEDLSGRCPYCHGGRALIQDGDTVPGIVKDIDAIPSDFALVLCKCVVCGKNSWAVALCFAAKRLLEATENQKIEGESFLNSLGELPIHTRMMWNCERGDERYFECETREGFLVPRWHMTEYTINGRDPFQDHRFGPFKFFSEEPGEGGIVTEYGVACCGRNDGEYTEWDLAAQIINGFWDIGVELTEARDRLCCP